MYLGEMMRPLHLVIPTLALLLSHHAMAQGSYPDRPIKMIVPLAAASAVDVAARIVTQTMADNNTGFQRRPDRNNGLCRSLRY
jgi:tripartite-type tricarboxylate transporter receptor subunit TctC